MTHCEEREPHISRKPVDHQCACVRVCVSKTKLSIPFDDYGSDTRVDVHVTLQERATSKIQRDDDLSLKTRHTHSPTHALLHLFEILFFFFPY